MESTNFLRYKEVPSAERIAGGWLQSALCEGCDATLLQCTVVSVSRSVSRCSGRDGGQRHGGTVGGTFLVSVCLCLCLIWADCVVIFGADGHDMRTACEFCAA